MFGTYASKAGEPHLNNMETEVIAGHDGKVKWRWSARDIFSEEMSRKVAKTPTATAGTDLTPTRRTTAETSVSIPETFS